ncbi:MAG: TatD family hydrolase [Bryobacterales bacterium]
MIIDSHCHLDDAAFDEDRDAVVARAHAAGVDLMLAIGTGEGPPDLECAIRLAEHYEGVYATVGVHPHDASQADAASLDRLAELCGHPKVVALGEIGLDYHYDHSPREIQREVFVNQMQIARQARKPIVIHTREAWEDTMELLETHWRPGGLGGIMHCFSGDSEQAREALDLGFLVSFAGVVTFRRAEALRGAAAATPLDRLLVETDAPYLTPEPYRKIRRNEPRYVVETARKVAEVRRMPYEALAAATSRNFCALFNLPVPA